jgi:antitoxin FitA
LPRLLAEWQHQLQNAGMPTSITIRDVPDETRDELAARAALTGRSLQEYLRSKLVELARQPDAETLVERIRSRKAATSSSLPPDRILAHHDADRP